MSNNSVFSGCHCTSKLQFSEYGNVFFGSYPPKMKSVFANPVGVQVGVTGSGHPLSWDWLKTSAATPLRLLGGGGGGVVPNGLLLRQPVPLHVVAKGTVNGSSVVTPNGPLMPNPALGENSVKNSPRSA